MANEQQSTYWRGRSGSVWVERQEALDRELDDLGQLALDRLAARPGERILDVGCGCGSTSMALARAVGPDGAVVGVDFSTPQVEAARERAAGAGLDQLTFVDADAQAEPIPGGPFDAAYSRFGVMFFNDPVAAFANVHAAMAPAARLGFVCWQGAEANPWFGVPARALAGLPGLELPPPPPPEAPGPLALADPERLGAILTAAGWKGIAVEGAEDDLVLEPGVLDEWVRFVTRQGPIGELLTAAPEDVQREATTRVRARMESEGHREGLAGLRFPRGAWVVTARAG
ncbi:MAG TPA: class I SAM-dependent methyltransferase [Acidimicrobiales bacterium]|nr:class I SAM-dependent methyltransferase [Acidimicrobiales bacterium]